jgi:hypothetical protein
MIPGRQSIAAPSASTHNSVSPDPHASDRPMTDDKRDAEADAAIEREIRQGRKLTPRDLMAHIAGPGSMKGGSPISQVQEAENAIGVWLGANLADADGALKAVLHRHLKGSALLLDHLDQPLVAIAEGVRRLLAADNLLKDIVSEADVEWGRAMDERPYFEREGAAPHPDDPYTLDSVRRTLRGALERLPNERSPN